MRSCRFDAVIHFAGRKAVGESVSQPMLYYTHNVVAAVNLIEAMRKHNLKNVSGILRRFLPSTSAMLSPVITALGGNIDAEATVWQPGGAMHGTYRR